MARQQTGISEERMVNRVSRIQFMVEETEAEESRERG